MIKQVVYVDDSVRCEKLLAIGYTLEYANTVFDSLAKYTTAMSAGNVQHFVCGNQADVKLDPNGDTPDIEMCFWSYCQSGSNCLVPQTTDPNAEPVPICLACEDVYINNEHGISPSSSVCASLSLPTIYDANDEPMLQTCFYTEDPEVVGLDALFGNGSCAMLKMACPLVTQCSHYDNQEIIYSSESGANTKELDDLRISDKSDYPQSFKGGLQGDYSLGDACKDDPCEVKAKASLQFGCITETDFQYVGYDCVTNTGNNDRGPLVD